MTKFEQILLQNWDIKLSGKNVQISPQDHTLTKTLLK